MIADIDPREADRLAGHRIRFEQHSREVDVVFRHGEWGVHRREELVEDRLRLPPDHAVVGAGHPQVGDERGALGEDAIVRGRDVGVRAEDAADAAVEVPRRRHLLARRFRMKFDDANLHVVGEIGEDVIEGVERAVDVLHEHAPEDHDQPDLHPVLDLDHVLTGPESLLGIVHRAEESLLLLVDLEVVFPLPGVIPHRHQIDPRPPQVAEDAMGDPRARRRVLGVGDDEIERELPPETRELLANDPTPRLPDDVSDDQDLQRSGAHVTSRTR